MLFRTLPKIAAREIIWVMILTSLLLLPATGYAQSLNIDFSQEGGSTASRIFQLLALVTILSVAPSILVMVTAFTRIVVVLSFLRHALGTQTSPPNTVIVSLALFLTGFVMAPTFQASYEQGIAPLIAGKMDEMTALEKAAAPVHAFMRKHVRERDLKLFIDMARVAEGTAPEAIPYAALIPAFIISELRRAFEMGFLLFLPFLIIDMVIASVLMSMGMMMVPPVMIAMPFKLIFFVLVDGWYMIAGSLVQSFGPPG